MAKRQRVGGRSSGGDFLLQQHFDPAQWIHVDEAALPKDRREQFLKRKRAIELYADGANDAMLREETGLKRRNVYRLIADRCLQQADDGTVLGWRGALPFIRIKAYTRHAAPKVDQWGDGAVGALQWLFSSTGGHQLEARFRQQILGKTRALAAAKQPRQTLFHWFIEELRRLGYEQRGEWPFNVERMGYVTICGFIFHQKVKTTGFSRSALAAPIGPLGIITEVGKVWFSSLARGAKWVDFSPLRLARTHQL